MITLKGYNWPSEIEDRTVLFYKELSIPDFEMTKLGNQRVDFRLFLGNHVKLQFD